MLERVQRVVMNEDFDRPLRRQVVRGVFHGMPDRVDSVDGRVSVCFGLVR